MNTEPNLMISISGSHNGKGIVGAVIAEALKKKNINNIAHLNYDQETFDQMVQIINENDESNLASAQVLLIEYEDDYIDEIYVQQQQTDKEENINNSVE